MSGRSVDRARRAAVAALVAVVAAVAAPYAPAREPAASRTGLASSGMWLCPHGGGEGWRISVVAANPGEGSVEVRVRELGADGVAGPSTVVSIPGGETRTIPVVDTSDDGADGETLGAQQPASGTVVEYFGGWVAAGWIAVAPDGAEAAETCSPRPSRTWYVLDGASTLAEAGRIVIMNPYSTDAVYSVSLYSIERDGSTAQAPVIRTDDLTDEVLTARSVASVDIGATILGRAVVAMLVETVVGRVVASSVIRGPGVLRAELGYPSIAPESVIPVAGGSGARNLLVLTPGEPAGLGGAILTDGPEAPVPSMRETEPSAASIVPFVYSDGGFSGLDFLGGRSALAAVRLPSRATDSATVIGGVPGRAWVVLPTSTRTDAEPQVVLVNPGEAAVTVTLRVLSTVGPEPISIQIPPRASLLAPADFMAAAIGSAVLVTSDTWPFVAGGASTWRGDAGADAYAATVGARIAPGRVVLPPID